MNIEYSGPNPGDARDPKLTREVMPETVAEIMLRAQNNELWAARRLVIELENKVSSDYTSVTESEGIELKAARDALVSLEQQESARIVTQRAD